MKTPSSSTEPSGSDEDSPVPVASENLTLSVGAFLPLGREALGELRHLLWTVCREEQLKGTVLLTPTGMNLVVAGRAQSLDRFVEELQRQLPRSESDPVHFFRTPSRGPGFAKLLVRVGRELTEFRRDGALPGQRRPILVPASELRRWIELKHPILLLDLRDAGDQEANELPGAYPLHRVYKASDIPEALRGVPFTWKHQPIVLFCQDGVRSLRSGPVLEHLGFEQVFVLQGGLTELQKGVAPSNTKPATTVLSSHPRQTYSSEDLLRRCFVCFSKLPSSFVIDPRYVDGQSCPACYRSPAEQMKRQIQWRHFSIRSIQSTMTNHVAMDQFKPLDIQEADAGKTLSEVVRRKLPHIPVQQWDREFHEGRWTDAQGKVVDGSQRVRAGERYRHRFPGVSEPAVNANVVILHEDEALVALNKPAPLPMHAGGRFFRNTLQTILNDAYLPEEPRPAHRLDANTTGIVLVTRSRAFAAFLQTQFARNTVEKIYLARVVGHPASDRFECCEPISATSGPLGSRCVDQEQGLPAHTGFRVLERRSDGTSLLEVRPRTGRTNQIRIHLWHMGWPIHGDPAYLPGGKLGDTQTLPVQAPPLCLHAWKIRVIHPLTLQPTQFTAPAPAWAEAHAPGHQSG